VAVGVDQVGAPWLLCRLHQNVSVILQTSGVFETSEVSGQEY
jgi:hypothetical protein